LCEISGRPPGFSSAVHFVSSAVRIDSNCCPDETFVEDLADDIEEIEGKKDGQKGFDDSKTVIGYEISFNKYFDVHQPLRDLAEVVKEIRDLEAETEGLLEQTLDFSSTGH
jgi:hypothetical protein